jgi:hypothetical protein
MSSYVDELGGVVSLTFMDCSLVEFARRIRVALEFEQSKPNPDAMLIALLCDAARFGKELLDKQDELNKLKWSLEDDGK